MDTSEIAALTLAFTVASLLLHRLTEGLGRRHGIDRRAIEGRLAGYDAADLAAIFTRFGPEGVRLYRDRLVPLDWGFAALVAGAGLSHAIWATLTSGLAPVGLLAGGALVSGALVDLREGLALRALFAAWLRGEPLDDGLVARAAARTRLKIVLYTSGIGAAALVALSLWLGWLSGGLLVAGTALATTAFWWFRG